MIPVHITAGSLSYTGLYASTIDAMLDALDRFGHELKISVKAIKKVADGPYGMRATSY